MKYTLFTLMIWSTLSQSIPIKIETLKKEQQLYTVFDQKEIVYLKSIVTLFDSVITAETGIVDVVNAYNVYFAEVREKEPLSKIYADFGMDTTTEMNSFIKSFHKTEIFSEIWEYSYGGILTAKGWKPSRFLAINRQGKYVNLLKKIGKDNPLIKEYVESIFSEGDIGIRGTWLFFKYQDYNEIDFNLDIYRLIWAIHYISLTSTVALDEPSEVHLERWSKYGSPDWYKE